MKCSVSFPVFAVFWLAALVPAQSTSDALHAWVAAKDPAALEKWINDRLANEKADINKLIVVTGRRTVENTLAPYDDAQNELAIAGNNAYLMYSVADAAPMRDMGQKMEAVVSAATTDLSLNQQVYRALAAVPLPSNDSATRYYLEHTRARGRAGEEFSRPLGEHGSLKSLDQ